jgi:hypothetical protein
VRGGLGRTMARPERIRALVSCMDGSSTTPAGKKIF